MQKRAKNSFHRRFSAGDRRDWPLWAIATGVVLSSLARPASAQFSIAHDGATDPLTEGFQTATFGSSSAVGPVSNDLGLPAWSVVGSARDAQFGYVSGPLTAAQQADIAQSGFTLTMTARVLPGMAPSYDAANHVVIGEALLDTGAKRFNVELGLDGNGDTVAVLATDIDNAGPGFSIRAPGPSYTLTGSGSSYHTYSLIYDPSTMLAHLLVDGVDRIDGYSGDTSFVANRGLIWGANSGGQTNFNLVQVTSGIPEPGTFAMVCALCGLLLCHPRRRARTDE